MVDHKSHRPLIIFLINVSNTYIHIFSLVEVCWSGEFHLLEHCELT